MKKLLAAMFVALLMVGCGEDAQNKAVQNEAPFVEKWAEWEANPKPYGGLKVLAKIKWAKESGNWKLNLIDNEITDLSPLKELTNLSELCVYGSEITDLSPLKGLTNLKNLDLRWNQISDLSPLKGLTNLRVLSLTGNQISDLSPLKGLTKLEHLWIAGNPITEDHNEMLRKSLPKCKSDIWKFEVIP